MVSPAPGGIPSWVWQATCSLVVSEECLAHAGHQYILERLEFAAQTKPQKHIISSGLLDYERVY